MISTHIATADLVPLIGSGWEDVPSRPFFRVLYNATHRAEAQTADQIYSWVNTAGREEALLQARASVDYTVLSDLHQQWTGYTNLHLEVLADGLGLQRDVWHRHDVVLGNEPPTLDALEAYPLGAAVPKIWAAEALLDRLQHAFATAVAAELWLRATNERLAETPAAAIRRGRWIDVLAALEAEGGWIPVLPYQPEADSGLKDPFDGFPPVGPLMRIPSWELRRHVECRDTIRIGFILGEAWFAASWSSYCQDAEEQNPESSIATPRDPERDRALMAQHMAHARWWLGSDVSDLLSFLEVDSESELQSWLDGAQEPPRHVLTWLYELDRISNDVRDLFAEQRAAHRWIADIPEDSEAADAAPSRRALLRRGQLSRFRHELQLLRRNGEEEF